MSLNKLPEEQLLLINRFLEAYNELDDQLRTSLKESPNISFSKLVDIYTKNHPRWTEKKFLKKVADLRNFLVHEMDSDSSYPAIPTQFMVENLERVLNQFLRPDPVIPKFQREVINFQIDDSLQKVLKVIYQKSYSQFPIYNESVFEGLLTENGITRWLSKLAVTNTTIIDFDENPIKSILTQEEKRKNFSFIPRSSSTIEAEKQFVNSPALEALLITQNGKQNEKLLGIITRWDIFNS